MRWETIRPDDIGLFFQKTSAHKIQTLRAFNKEFSQIIDGQEKAIINKLIHYIEIMVDSTPAALEKHEKFEHLKHSAYNLWSLHIDTKEKNLRLLFTIQHDGNIMLAAFHERDDSGQDSYDRYIEKAENRLKSYNKGGI